MIILGTAGMMSGYTRMTYSLAVILMETSMDINLFVPIVFTVLISNQVGFMFTRGLYDRAVRGKQMPVLQDFVPHPCRSILAEQIMSKDIVKLQRVEKLSNLFDLLNTSHHGFPVVNAAGNLIGLIPKNFIMTII
jgi:chloride channel 7